MLVVDASNVMSLEVLLMARVGRQSSHFIKLVLVIQTLLESAFLTIICKEVYSEDPFSYNPVLYGINPTKSDLVAAHVSKSSQK